MSTRMEEDQATLERILTRDREYSTELMHRIFASNTEESRLTTSRLLASIYEYKGQQNLYVQGLPVEKRVQHYLEQTRWLTESCQLYAEAARTVGEAETHNAVMREWDRWARVLEGEWATQTGTEEDMACPTTATELAQELLATMRPVRGTPGITGSVQSRRLEYRREVLERQARWCVREEEEGVCV